MREYPTAEVDGTPCEPGCGYNIVSAPLITLMSVRAWSLGMHIFTFQVLYMHITEYRPTCINPFSTGTVFRRQNLTSKDDPRIEKNTNL